MGRLKTSLPLEVFAIVIDYLEGDSQSLKSCTLVCRSWLQFSRPHLFRSLRIDLSNPESKSRTKRLADGSAVHCSYVQTLQIGVDSDNSTGCFPITYHRFSQMVRNLPHLRTLSLEEKAVCKFTLDDPTPSLLSIDKLVLWFTSFEPKKSIQHLLAPLALFSRINHLVIDSDDDGDEDPGTDVLTDLRPASHLQINSLSVFATSPCLLTLRKLLKPTLRTLTALHTRYCPTDTHYALGKLIHDAAPSMCTFTLNVCHPIEADVPPIYLTESYWTILNLSECRALESITLVIQSRVSFNPSSTVVTEMFCNILQCVPLTIRKLVFELGPYHFGETYSHIFKFPLHLEQMEATISKFTHLGIIAFELITTRNTTSASLNQWEEFIAGKLPKLQHLLQFSTVERDIYSLC